MIRKFGVRRYLRYEKARRSGATIDYSFLLYLDQIIDDAKRRQDEDVESS